MSNTDSIKRCSRCNISKPLGEFNRIAAAKDNHSACCRDCDKQRQKLWRIKNRENTNRKQREALQRMSSEEREERNQCQRDYYRENREALLEAKRKHYHENKEEMQQRSRTYRENNREKFLESLKRYNRENRDKLTHYAKRRRNKLKGAGGKHTLDDVRCKYEEQKGCCYWCAVPLNGSFDVDHIIPISKGGGDSPGNICCSCRDCNRRKHAKMPWEFSDRLF